MKKLIILGGGTAGTMMANKLRHMLEKDTWDITVIDKQKTHYYQPGFLFIPFGIYKREDVKNPGLILFRRVCISFFRKLTGSIPIIIL